MDNIKKYGQLVKTLIKKSFPSLKKIRIGIKEKKLRKSSMKAIKIFDCYYILIHPYFRNKSRKAIIGALAHELCHLEDLKKKNFLQLITDSIRYILSKKHKQKIERKTDIRTVQKGYGKELLLQRKLREKMLGKKLFKKRSECYLSNEEISKRIKKK